MDKDIEKMLGKLEEDEWTITIVGKNDGSYKCIYNGKVNSVQLMAIYEIEKELIKQNIIRNMESNND